MSLHDQIVSDLTSALKAGEKEKAEALRLIKASLLHKQKEAGDETLSDEVVIAVLAKEAKKRKESIDAFEQGDREDLAAKERQELIVIEGYLPEQHSDEELESIVAEVISEVGSGNFGAVMGAVMKRVGPQADGNAVKKIVQQQLAK